MLRQMGLDLGTAEAPKIYAETGGHGGDATPSQGCGLSSQTQGSHKMEEHPHEGHSDARSGPEDSSGCVLRSALLRPRRKLYARRGSLRKEGVALALGLKGNSPSLWCCHGSRSLRQLVLTQEAERDECPHLAHSLMFIWSVTLVYKVAPPTLKTGPSTSANPA